ncbi:MAG TPA: alpha/beta fold hydrolase, partial [Methanocorpusculum sp.]|nr:alpha/beta fold hydrolase [Methanocorpusculum sp.]
MISLAYKKAGEGKPLILLHGNGGSSDDFALQIDCFSGFREVISVDTRGHGNSPRGDVPMSFPQFAKDILAFLDEQEIAKADIIGCS